MDVAEGFDGFKAEDIAKALGVGDAAIGGETAILTGEGGEEGF